MTHFHYQHDQLYVEGLPAQQLAERWGTPCYIYSRAAIEANWSCFDRALAALPHLICYAVKANSNLAVLNLLARLGSGFDIVSVGELERVLAAGGDPSKVVFSGVGKSRPEILRALSVGIGCFNVESVAELTLINELAESLSKVAPCSLRINPDVDAQTHPYIATGLKENKFGIECEQARSLYQWANTLPGIELKGITCHIGSQITTLEPFLAALDQLLVLVDQLASDGIVLKHIDMGGGLGVQYRDESPPTPAELVEALSHRLGSRPLTLHLEPGRSIVAKAGILVTQVIFLKHAAHKNFAIVDAGMNDLLRPALYNAWQDIKPVMLSPQTDTLNYDVVGPVCETGDFLGKNRALCLQANDLLAVFDAGAYGFVMSSNYNSRPRVAEIMVDKHQSYLVRRRETIEELFAGEVVLPPSNA